MSKIGRKPIDIRDVKVEIKGQDVHYTGKVNSGVHTLPEALVATVEGQNILLTAKKPSRDAFRLWGLHRALLSNAISGARKEFEKLIEINGLGFKAALSGQNVVFSLGYSHKIDFALPKEVSLVVDKTGQKLTFKSTDRELLGHVCGLVRALRPPEPYKGTGIKLATEVLFRKAGKTKSS